ncbi:hypothetical protein Tco_1512067 [Tanacetum coccineum]
MLLLSLRAIPHFLPLQMFLKFTCTNSGILFTSIILPTELGNTGDIKSITNVVVDHIRQPWRTFSMIINKSLSRKTTGLEKLCLSRAQILWGMYYKKNVDYVELLWEDFTYQIENTGHREQKQMYYPRFVYDKS